MLTCPNCNKEVNAGAKFCSHCGTPIPEKGACPGCGLPVGGDMAFCPHCGTPVTQKPEAAPAGEPFDFSDVDVSKVAFYTPEGEQTGYIDNNGEKVVPEYVLKINGIPVSLEEYRYPYLSIKTMKDNGDTALWTEEAAEESRLTEEDVAAMEKEALDYLKQTTLYQFMSVKYNLPLTGLAPAFPCIPIPACSKKTAPPFVTSYIFVSWETSPVGTSRRRKYFPDTQAR